MMITNSDDDITDNKDDDGDDDNDDGNDNDDDDEVSIGKNIKSKQFSEKPSNTARCCGL